MGSVGSRGKKVAPAGGQQRDRRGDGGSLKPLTMPNVSDFSPSRDRAAPARRGDCDVTDAESRAGIPRHPGRGEQGSGLPSSCFYTSELSKEASHPWDADRRVAFKKDFHSQHSGAALCCPGGLSEKDSFQDHSLTKETASVPGTCEALSSKTPVIHYNQSEEDLMETIEREYS